MDASTASSDFFSKDHGAPRRTARDWLLKGMEKAGCSDGKDVLAKQFCAVSTAVQKAKEFGIEEVRDRSRTSGVFTNFC